MVSVETQANIFLASNNLYPLDEKNAFCALHRACVSACLPVFQFVLSEQSSWKDRALTDAHVNHGQFFQGFLLWVIIKRHENIAKNKCKPCGSDVDMTKEKFDAFIELCQWFIDNFNISEATWNKMKLFDKDTWELLYVPPRPNMRQQVQTVPRESPMTRNLDVWFDAWSVAHDACQRHDLDTLKKIKQSPEGAKIFNKYSVHDLLVMAIFGDGCMRDSTEFAQGVPNQVECCLWLVKNHEISTDTRDMLQKMQRDQPWMTQILSQVTVLAKEPPKSIFSSPCTYRRNTKMAGPAKVAATLSGSINDKCEADSQLKTPMGDLSPSGTRRAGDEPLNSGSTSNSLTESPVPCRPEENPVPMDHDDKVVPQDLVVGDEELCEMPNITGLAFVAAVFFFACLAVINIVLVPCVVNEEGHFFQCLHIQAKNHGGLNVGHVDGATLTSFMLMAVQFDNLDLYHGLIHEIKTRRPQFLVQHPNVVPRLLQACLKHDRTRMCLQIVADLQVPAHEIAHVLNATLTVNNVFVQ